MNQHDQHLAIENLRRIQRARELRQLEIYLLDAVLKLSGVIGFIWLLQWMGVI